MTTKEISHYESPSEVRVPNLFLIGAPKCGTTALSHYLAGHPSIFMSEKAGIKEPDYFGSDFRFNPEPITCFAAYLRLFSAAPSTARYLGEASVSYLFSQVAVKRILKLSPNARFVVMVRNPLELACALHNQRVKYEADVSSFSRAWHLQDERKQGRALPPTFQDGTPLQYGEIAKLGEQLYRVFQQVDRDQVHVIIYDDFATDTAGCYGQLISWLDLPRDDRTDFPRLNQRVGYRWASLQAALGYVSRTRHRLGIPGGVGIHAAITKLNSVNKGNPLPSSLKLELCKYFREDVTLLSSLLDRDLSHWLR